MTEFTATVPAELEPYVDDQLLEAHAKLVRASLKTIRRELPPVQHPENVEGASGYVDLSPREDHDRRSAVVVPLSFANGWDANAAIRTRLLQRALPVPQRVIVFPNNTVSNPNMYSLNKVERSALTVHGNFDPLAKRHMRTLDALAIERVQVVGYSMGASVGAALLRRAAGPMGWEGPDFELGPSGLFEPPNVMERDLRELWQDFMAAGKRFNVVVNESAVPALSEVQSARGGTMDTMRQIIVFARYVRGMRLPDNRALLAAMREDAFCDDVMRALDADPGLHITVGVGEKSRITRKNSLKVFEDFSRGENYAHRLHTMRIAGYGHELCDNIVAHALLGRLALNPPTLPGQSAK